MTLSELLIAMGLTSVVAVMLLSVAQTQTSISGQGQQTIYMQDNGRAAVEEITAAVRDTGKTTLQGFAYNMIPPQAPARYPMIIVNNNTLGVAGGDSPDSLQLVVHDTSTMWTTLEAGGLAKNSFWVNNVPGLAQNDYVIISNFQSGNGGLYRLSAAPTAGSLLGVAALLVSVTPGGANPDPAVTTGPGALLNRVRFVRYRIDLATLGGLPALVLEDGFPFAPQAPQLVAEGIEDLQIAAGVDGLLDGVPDGALREVGQAANDDEWVYNIAGEAMPVALPGSAYIAALRITVVSRSPYPELNSDPGAGRPAAEDRPAGPPDTFRRRVMTTTIGVRPMIVN